MRGVGEDKKREKETAVIRYYDVEAMFGIT
jgi:hypothetical protein